MARLQLSSGVRWHITVADDMEPEFERVHTIDDWYDGPRLGAADYYGVPHWYRSMYLDSDEWDPLENRFELFPLTADVLEWVVEDHHLRKRWEAAATSADRNGSLDTDDVLGVLVEDQPRHAELRARIEAHLAGARPRAIIVRGEFSEDALHVRWVHYSN